MVDELLIRTLMSPGGHRRRLHLLDATFEIVPGRARGPVVGGNLNLLAALLPVATS